MKSFLRLSLPLVAAFVVAHSALADAKGEAILKEVELRARKINTYSADMKVINNGKPESAALWIQRPDKLFFTFTEGKIIRRIVVNGSVGRVTQGNKAIPIPPAETPALKANLWNIVTGNVRALVGEFKEAKYVTQKLIDDVTVLDVIDVIGSKATVRLYVNGNSFVERVVSNEKAGPTLTDFTFLNLKIDEPIPAERFTLPALSKS